jgi:hypothetical protein
MLAFLRQEMVGNAKKRFHGNIQADFLAGFPDRTFFERL